MNRTKKALSPALFGFIILCLIIPLVSIFKGNESAILNGIDFIKGMSKLGLEKGTEPLAIIALVSAVIGLGVGFWRQKAGYVIAVLAGVVGLICIIVMKLSFENYAMGEQVQTETMGGYYLVLVLFAAAAAFNIYLTASNGPTEEVSGGPKYEQPNEPRSGNAFSFCTRCGSKLYPGYEFCTECGNRVKGSPESPVNRPQPSFDSPVVSIDADLHFSSLSAGKEADFNFDSQMFSNTQPVIAPVDDNMTRILKPALTPVFKIDRSGQEEIIRLDKDEFLIGRSPEGVDYTEKSSNAVSRRHAKIIKENGVYYVTDLNSQNGTFLNDQRLEDEKIYVLQPGDIVKLADLTYIFDEI